MEKEKILRLIKIAYVFAKSSRIAGFDVKDDPRWEEPYFAKAIFDQHTALELFLKAILLIDGREYSNCHSFTKIYELIPGSYQRNLENIFRNQDFIEHALLTSNDSISPEKPEVDDPGRTLVEFLFYLDNRGAFKERYSFFEEYEVDTWTTYIDIPLKFFDDLFSYVSGLANR